MGVAMGFKPISPSAYVAGLAAGRDDLARSSIAESVRYDTETDRIMIVFPACEVAIPHGQVREFAGLDTSAMATIRLSAVGDALAVGDSDVHVDIGGLLAELLPPAVVAKAIAKRGGRSRSSAKASAARRNGIKGGRPRKLPAA
jgi:hypothetical protein